MGKYCLIVPVILLLIFAQANAANVDVTLDSKDGSSNLVIKNSDSSSVATINSLGSLEVGRRAKAYGRYLLTGVTDQGDGLIADDTFERIFSLTRNTGNEIRLQGYGPLTFWNNGATGTEKMRILTNGNVGIGTINPQTRLEVRNSPNTSYGAMAGTYFVSPFGVYGYTNDTFGIGIIAEKGGSGGLALWANGDSEIANGKFSVSGGNVGIGTTSPQAKLHVYHNDSHGGIILDRNNASVRKSQISFRQQGTERWSMGNDVNQTGAQNFFVYDSTAGQTRMLIDSNGYVGVATMSASAPLHVYTTRGDAYAGIAIQKSTGKTLTINQGTSNRLNFSDPGVVDLMTLDFPNQRVGIREPNPAYTLQVTGTGRFTSLLYPASFFCDGSVALTGLSASSGTALVLNGGYVYTYSSSKRYKHDIRDYSEDLSKLTLLRPVRFKWNQNTGSPNKEDIGLIAEEVLKVFPELIGYNPSGEVESVDYSKLSVILLKDAQEKRKEIDGLKAENQDLKTRLKAIEDKIGR